MRLRWLACSLFAAGLGGLVFATAAHAKPATLNTSAVGATAGYAPMCDGPLANPPGAAYDGWHFILPANTGDSFTSLTVTFSGGTVAGPLRAVFPARNSARGWIGFLDNGGMGGGVRHAYIFTTPPGRSIVSATAEVSGGGPDGFFNLTETCAGTTASTVPSSAAPSVTSPSARPASPSSPVSPAGRQPAPPASSAPSSAAMPKAAPSNGSPNVMKASPPPGQASKGDTPLQIAEDWLRQHGNSPYPTKAAGAPGGGSSTGGGGSQGFTFAGLGALVVASGLAAALAMLRRMAW